MISGWEYFSLYYIFIIYFQKNLNRPNVRFIYWIVTVAVFISTPNLMLCGEKSIEISFVQNNRITKNYYESCSLYKREIIKIRFRIYN